MKSNCLYSQLGLIVIGMLLTGCSPTVVTAPAGTVPKRSHLAQDVYGSYVTLTTSDSAKYSGELIGVRNDSLVVFNEKTIRVARNNLVSARVIIHNPNDYKGVAFGMAIPGLLNFFHVPEFGAAPGALAMATIVNNAIGLGAAQATENRKVNFIDLKEGWEKMVLFSRFPMGIPLTIRLDDLRGREVEK